MLVEYFSRVSEYLKKNPVMFHNYRVRCTPTTIVREGSKYKLDAKGEMFRILTPRGPETVDSMEAALRRWKTIGLQQLASTHGDIFQASSGGEIKRYSDYFLECEKAGDGSDVTAAVGDMISLLEELFGDPITVRFFEYKNNFFIFEVAPIFWYEQRPASILKDYRRLLMEKKLDVEELLSKLRRYHDFLGEMDYPQEMVQELLNWLVMETGNGCFVGLIDGTSVPEKELSSRVEPTGRLYRIAGVKDVPDSDFTPMTNNIAVLFGAEIVNSAKLPAVFRAFMKTADSWSNSLKNITVYLDGLSHIDEFKSVATKLGCTLPIGVCVSSWGQALKIKSDGSICQVVDDFMLDVDSLVTDGLFDNKYRECNIPMKFDLEMWRNIQSVFSHIGVIFAQKYDLGTLAYFGMNADYFYTTGEHFKQAVISLAAAKVHYDG